MVASMDHSQQQALLQELSPQLRQAQEQLSELQEYFEVDADDLRYLIINPLVEKTRAVARQIILESTTQLAVAIQNETPLGQQEFVRWITERNIRRHGKRLQQAFRETPDKSQFMDMMRTFTQTAIRRDIESVLRLQMKNVERNVPDEEGARMLLRLFEKNHVREREDENGQRLPSHFINLLREGRAKLRRVTMKDIPAIKRLYQLYQYDGEDIVDTTLQHFPSGSVEGEKVRQRFLYDFEDYEEGFFSEQLQRSEWLQNATTEYRQKYEMMEGWAVASDVDEDDILAVCIVTRSPKDPKNNLDPCFYEREEKYFYGGASGGTMYYANDEERKNYHKYLLNEPNMRLVLILSKEPGMADVVHAKTIDALTDTGKKTPYLSYTMDELEVIYNDVLLKELEPKCGQNTECMAWGPKNGLGVTQNWNENTSAPFKAFKLETKDIYRDGILVPGKKGIIKVRPKWRELLGTKGSARSQTKYLLKKFGIPGSF